MNESPQEVSDWFWDIISQSEGQREKLYAILDNLSKEEVFRFQDEFLTAVVDLTDEEFIAHMVNIQSEYDLDFVCKVIVSQGKATYMELYVNPELFAEYSYEKMRDMPYLFAVAYELYEEKYSEPLILDG